MMVMDPGKWPIWKRAVIGGLHAFCHLFTAYNSMIVMQGLLQLALDRQLFAQQSLFDTLCVTFPPAVRAFEVADDYTYGMTSAMSRSLSQLFDLPDAMMHYHVDLCSDEPARHTRFAMLAYFIITFLYYYVLVAPFVSFVLGSYLYLASAILDAHLTEAFSSLRIESYKNFVRLHINKVQLQLINS